MEIDYDPTSEVAEIPGFPMYYASKHGSVWSFHPPPRANGRYAPRKLSAYWSRETGYLRISMKRNAGPLKYTELHTAVLLAFVGPRPAGMVGRHLNGNKLDNRLENLAWGTQRENIADAIKHGTFLHGEKSPRAKLSKADVETIRLMADRGDNQHDIAKMFGVTASNVSIIHRRKSWRMTFSD